MPLIKRSDSPLDAASVSSAKIEAQDSVTGVLGVGIGSVDRPSDPGNPHGKGEAYTGRKKTDTMTKDDYWRNKEERELLKDPMIRLSGVLQALLGSVNFGQYCVGTTADEYLDKVEQSALRLAKFVAENGK